MTHHTSSRCGIPCRWSNTYNGVSPRSRSPGCPAGDPQLHYFINRLVLTEGSGRLPDTGDNPIHGSHFELYCDAMDEVGADAHWPWKFLDLIHAQGIDAASTRT